MAGPPLDRSRKMVNANIAGPHAIELLKIWFPKSPTTLARDASIDRD
jgi:hypothetical protein